VKEGHRNHMRAINTVNRAGGIRRRGRAGVLKSGMMYELVKHGVPYVLAGSIRDDGPLARHRDGSGRRAGRLRRGARPTRSWC
jgi:hypothetical protein